MDKWHTRFLDLADHIREWSKDPSTQTGAVIVRADRTVVGVGYNGFPRGVVDSEERYLDRETKYAMVVHAEANAILHSREDLTGATIYVYPWPPCNECAKLIIESGISRVVSIKPTAEQLERWGKSMDIAKTMFGEANVEFITLS